MGEHDERRRKSDKVNIAEPQTLEDFVRAIYARQSNVIDNVDQIKQTVYGNGKPGLCARMIKIETILTATAWLIGVGLPATFGFMVLFNRR